MTRILLISCNTTTEPYPVYPLGMEMVAQAATVRGHEVTQWDLLRDPARGDNFSRQVAKARPEIIGLSLRNIDNVNSCKHQSYCEPYREIVASLRGVSGAQIVLGGSGYSLFPEELLDEVKADYGVVGEGEVVFCDLVDTLAAGESPAKRILRATHPLDLRALPVQPRDPELASFYLAECGMLSVQTKRGCPHRCAYCTYPNLEGGYYRFRPANVIVDEIEMLIRDYGVEYYTYADSVFNDESGHYLAIAEELIRRGITTPWCAFFRPQRFTQSEVDILVRAGLDAAEWGTDCTTDVTLKSMRKGFTFDVAEHGSAIFSRSGVSCAHFVIFGGPGETEKTVRAGLENIERLERCVVFAFSGVRIMPRTAVYDLAVAEGVIAPDARLLNSPRPDVFYFSPQVRRAWLDNTIAEAFSGRRDRIFPPDSDLDKARAIHKLGHRGPAWRFLLRRRGRSRNRTI